MFENNRPVFAAENGCGGNCGCGHNQEEKAHECGCDHDHEHEHTLTLEMENGEELECPIIDIFEVNGKEYIALLHPEDEIAMLYGFVEHEDESVELMEIADEEYEMVSKVFDTLFADEDEEA